MSPGFKLTVSAERKKQNILLGMLQSFVSLASAQWVTLFRFQATDNEFVENYKCFWK